MSNGMSGLFFRAGRSYPEEVEGFLLLDGVKFIVVGGNKGGVKALGSRKADGASPRAILWAPLRRAAS